MTINIYGKEGCKLCEAAKQKLALLGKVYVEHNLEWHITLHEGWREDGSVPLQAFCQHVADDHIPMPIIEIDGKHYTYSQAMRKLKNDNRDTV